jgi:hypothetical protein
VRTILAIALLGLKQNALALSSPRRSRQNLPKGQQAGFEGDVQGHFQRGPVFEGFVKSRRNAPHSSGACVWHLESS